MKRAMHWLDGWLNGEMSRIEFYVIIAVLIGFIALLVLKLNVAETAVGNIENILSKL